MIVSNSPTYGDAYEGPIEYPPLDLPSDPPAAPASKLVTYTLGDLVRTFPEMREPVIHGLLRVGESMNIIASPKTGKSWLAAGLAYAVATGRDWLGYNTCAGDVLIVDNELHPETLASRLRRVAEANSIDLTDAAGRITILPLRGRLQNLESLGGFFRSQIPGRFRLVLVDAWYRSLPVGIDENDNAQIANLYNVLDGYADYLRCAFALIHHASKGDQSVKRVTDVGSGAGSQSRAADTHLILRTHTEDDAVVLEAVVRSFPPVSPRCLRWRFPSFTVAEDLDPANLRQTARSRLVKPDAEPNEPATPPEPPWTALRFAETFGTPDPKPRSMLIDNAIAGGLSERTAERLLRAALDADILFAIREQKQGKKITITNVRPAAKKPRRKRS